MGKSTGVKKNDLSLMCNNKQYNFGLINKSST